ncbi:MAG: hypothetical protein DHS20C11_13090 [Lysobacteraceae bacterium]|nr:MAG: hypothetical protein DHS20C11_13090 [Xanthomonadaceae bacterium]
MKLTIKGLTAGLLWGGCAAFSSANAAILDLSDTPLFLKETKVAPLTLLTLGKNHKLSYEAYNDTADLDGDGDLDVGYKPDEIDYFGYFDSYKCYTYDGAKFVPAATTSNKKCSGQWSGDFLNYVTTSRMDALRKVMYGGKRSTDSTTATVLERSFVPQDAHTWGKEYSSVANDGYDISEYTPLALPDTDKRHLFANVTLTSETSPPMMRVLDNSAYRVWEWVSIERPVAGTRCIHGGSGPNCATPASSGSYAIVPASDGTSFGLANLETNVYDITTSSETTPDNASEVATMRTTFGGGSSSAYYCGTTMPSIIDQSGNPAVAGACADNDESGHAKYMAITTGNLIVPAGGGTYTFDVNGDDAQELKINGNIIANWYGGHGQTNTRGSHTGSVTLAEGIHTIEYFHQEWTGGDSYELYYDTGPTPASTMTDYIVRTQVCVAGMLESDCLKYEDALGNVVYKPSGILQDFGENESMWFGLLTGSYEKNTQGGVLRKNIGLFTDEINAATGQFIAPTNGGIVDTMDKLRIAEFQYSGYQYEGPPSGGSAWITTRAITAGEMQDWGNPIAEMMYEGLRYFAGQAAPTPEYNISATGNEDAALGLPLPAWKNPYLDVASGGGGASECAKPFNLVISDINPNYDSDLLPGVDSEFGSGLVAPTSTPLADIDVKTLANTISSNEGDIDGTLRFIGQSGATEDSGPTPKTVAGLGSIRGLSPEEPTKEGSYYSASVGYYGLINDINDAVDDQKIDTFAVALASPLPRIEIPTDAGTVTMVPFAKSVGGCLGVSGTGPFQPTNTITDFYVESIGPTSGAFRINYEDVEQGADHDMDMIVRYAYRLNDDGTVTVGLNSEYAAGCIQQHAGYVISGTTADGTYLEVRDLDTGAGSDPDYRLDTPPGVLPGTASDWDDDVALPTTTTRTFTPGSTDGATLLKGPLWYAAKWGGFIDSNDNNLPDLDEEWDEDGDGDPDNYFLVTNALTLKEELNRTFLEILERVGTASGISLATGVIRQGGTTAYGTGFDSSDWSGAVDAIQVDETGQFVVDDTTGDFVTEWNAAELLDARDPATRLLLTSFDGGANTVEFTWSNFPSLLQTLFDDLDGLGSERVDYLRGDRSMETSAGGLFRDRGSVLGAVIHSEAHPVFAPREVYRDSGSFPEDQSDTGAPENASDDAMYSKFRADNADRAGMVYVGGNDGFLHAFDAESGEEKWAYAPSAVHTRLFNTTIPNWTYESFVDLTPTTRDVYFVETGTGWRTLLVGGMRHGGQLYYGIDVTEHPGDSPTAAAIGAKVLWEFSDADDADMGYSYGEPYIARFHAPHSDDGSAGSANWGVFVGNGYNSTEPDGNIGSGNAVLFVLNAETGEVIRKIDTGVQTDPLGLSRPNGLSAPTVVDYDTDDVGDIVYAGDLYGNMWEFDISSENPLLWGVANGGLPLFAASSDGASATSTNLQPILARPRVEFSDLGLGNSDLMVLFGTGKYIEPDDQTPLIPTQTFYGIRDRNVGCSSTSCAIDRSDLDQRTLTSSVTLGTETVRGLTDPDGEDFAIDSSNDGWYIDLTAGERVVSNAQFRGNLVLFPTLIPNTLNPCEPGGTSFLMAVDYRSGGPAGTGPDDPSNVDAPIDFNGDGVIDSGDLLSGGAMAVGLEFQDVVVGVTSTVVRGVGDDTILITTAGDGDGDCPGGVCQPKAAGVEHHRRSWRQKHNFE